MFRSLKTGVADLEASLRCSQGLASMGSLAGFSTICVCVRAGGRARGWACGRAGVSVCV